MTLTEQLLAEYKACLASYGIEGAAAVALEHRHYLSLRRMGEEVAERMVVKQANDIGEAIQNSEGAFQPSNTDIAEEIGWNAARTAQLKIQGEIIRELE